MKKPLDRKARQVPATPMPKAAPPYLQRTVASVRSDFRGAITLTELLANVDPLTRDERILIVKQALILIEQNYAHLPLKRAMHAVDPSQRLKLLLQSVEQSGELDAAADLAFHNELTEVFTSLRDLHTAYMLPEPYASVTAFLPFMVEDCFVKDECQYIVSHVGAGFEHKTFRPGVQIVYWNGVPISRAVHNNAQRYAGSNAAARHARGVQMLTIRPLRTGLPPDEEWVIVGYKTLAGKYEELRFDWVVSPGFQASADRVDSGDLPMASMLGLDLQQELVQRARTSLFAPHAKESSESVRKKVSLGLAPGVLESLIPEALEARAIPTTSGRFGYVRIRSFHVNPALFVNEFVRLIRALPQRGLIIDVRGNSGGIISSGEYLLQLLTPRRIEPEPVQFINTALNLQLCKNNDASSSFADLSQWAPSMSQALQTGSTFSAAFPLSDPEKCNAIGQRYFGPVVLITDALCYSTTDIFAAGFQDHEIGKIIGTDRNTGAGGANVWQQVHFVDFLLPAAGSVYKQLPKGAGMQVSMRRTLRTGRLSGTPVEDLGVVPDLHHPLTPDDILLDNTDLKDQAGLLLKEMPLRALSVKAIGWSGRTATLDVKFGGMSRMDIYVDDRPQQSRDLSGTRTEIQVTVSGSRDAIVELRGFDGTTLVARMRLSWLDITGASPDLGPGKKKSVTAARSTINRKAQSGSQLVTPNSGDDCAAAAVNASLAIGGSALAGSGETAALSKWRPAKSLLALVRQVNEMAPTRGKKSDGMIGDAVHATRSSDHNPWVRDAGIGVVTACDITHDPTHGCDAGKIAEAIRVSRDSRIKYIIWNRRIANSAAIGGKLPWTWRPYTGANPHDKHVHISVKPDKDAYDSTVVWSI